MNKGSGTGKSSSLTDAGSPPPFDPAAQLAKFRSMFKGVSDTALQHLVQYNAELLKFNVTLGLVSASTLYTADVVHFADSVFGSQLVHKNLIPGQPVFDIGSGNGFPGLVFGILYPDVSVILVERDKKRCEFLRHVIKTVEAKNILVEAVSVEEIAAKRIVNAVCRGYAPLYKAILAVRKQVAEGGRFFHFKGDGWANEVASVPSQLFSFWSPSLLGQYKLPGLPGDMAVIVTEKIAD